MASLVISVPLPLRESDSAEPSRWSELLTRHDFGVFGSRDRASHRSPFRYACCAVALAHILEGARVIFRLEPGTAVGLVRTASSSRGVGHIFIQDSKGLGTDSDLNTAVVGKQEWLY